MGSLSVAQEEELIIGLSNSEKLRLPARLSQAAPTLEDRKQYLQALLSHDPGVFLERHGKTLNAKQRQYFEPLRKGSYEVDFYLKLLEDEEKANMAKVQVSLAKRNICRHCMCVSGIWNHLDFHIARLSH